MPRKSSFSQAPIITAIREIDAGAKMVDVSRKVGVSTHTMARWRE